MEITAIKKALAKKANATTVRKINAQIRDLNAKLEGREVYPEGFPGLRLYQFTARVYHPNFGQALPDGVGYHDYVSIRLDDENVQGKIVSPSEDEVMSLLRLEAHQKHPNHTRIELASVSVLPQGW